MKVALIYNQLYSSQSTDVKGLAKGVFWSVFGSIFSRALLFIAWILMARILGKESYGEYGIIRNTVMMFSAFAGFGMGITGMKFIAQYIDTDRAKASRIASLTLSFSAILGTVVTIFVVIFSGIIAERTLKAPWLRTDFIIASLILLLCAYNGAQIGILNGLKRFKDVAKLQSLNAVISLPIFVLGAYFGVFWSVVAFAVSNLILCIQSSYYIKKTENAGEITIKYNSGWKEWRLLYQYSLPATLSGLMVIPVKWVSEVMLVNYSGFEAMGIFSAVLTINIMVSALSNTMSSPFISFMSSNKSDSGLIDKLNMLAPWFLGLIVCLPFMCFPTFGGYLFGKDYQGAEFNEAFVYVMLFTIILMYKQGMARIFAVKNMQWVGFLSNTIWGIFLLGSFYLLREKGAVGLTISYCIAYIVVTIIMYPIYIKRHWVPMEFIFSRYVFILWGMTAGVIYLSYIDMHWAFRIIYFVVAICITILTFKKMMKSNVKYSIIEN